MCDDPTDVFKFMKSKNIGVASAIFYEAYAYVLECKGQFSAVEKVYSTGLERKPTPAQPVERLKASYRAFLARSLSRAQNASSASDAQMPAQTQQLRGSHANSGGSLITLVCHILTCLFGPSYRELSTCTANTPDEHRCDSSKHRLALTATGRYAFYAWRPSVHTDIFSW